MVRVRNEMPYTATGKYTTETALQSKADQPLDMIYRHDNVDYEFDLDTRYLQTDGQTDRHTDRQTDPTENTTTPHSRVARTVC